MSKIYHCRPSEILKIDDEYTAFCFDEACAVIISRIQAGEKPTYVLEDENNPKEFKNFSEFYKYYGGK